MKNVVVIILLLTVSWQDVQSQDNASLIRQQFEKWQAAFPKYHVEGFFNQTKYSPGDTAWFNTFYLNEENGRVPGRQLLQASLFNCRGKLISHINFIVRDGVGFNQIVLPDTLKPGLYEVDIYSDWMKNFGRPLYFHHAIKIVNKNQISVPSRTSDEQLSFFPEGGSLVANVTNRVIVRAQGIPSTTASLIAGNGGLVTSFSIDNSGMGMIVFTPEAGNTYSAYVNERLYSLPVPVTGKVSVFLTTQQDRKPLKIILGASPDANLRNEDLSMLIISKGNLYASVPLKFGDKDYLQFAVPQNDLPPGAAELWILDSKGKPLASRLFPVANMPSVNAAVMVAPNPVNMRSKVVAELTLTDGSGNPVEGDFSVSVVSERLFANDSLEVRSQTAKPQSFNEWDRWLVTQPSPGYDWEALLSSDQHEPAYQMSRYYHKRGVAFDATTGVPVSDSIKISGFFLKNTNGYETYTNKEGEFDFMFLFDLWESDELFYTAERNGIEQKNVRIRWLREGDHSQLPCGLPTDQPDVYGHFAAKSRMIDRSYGFYTKPQRPEAIPESPNAILEDELSGADATINIHDYILFPTMAETIREVIPLLKHRTVNGKSIVRVFVDLDGYLPTGDPLYIIDGVITRDTEFFLSLVPDDVLTVKVVSNHNKLRALGNLGKNGVVFVHTKKEDASRLKSGTIVPVTGLNRAKDFNSANHGVDADLRIPDFRSTIYWAPALTVPLSGKKEFSFYAGDNIGPLRITVRGITKDGYLFNATAVCNVLFDPLQK